MNTHATLSPDRTLLPRGLLPRRPSANFRFELGTPVLSYGDIWIVTGRQRSSVGRECYWIYRHRDLRPLRLIQGDYIEPAPVVLYADELDDLLDIATGLKGPDSLYYRPDNDGPTRADMERQGGMRRLEMARQWSELLARAHRRGLRFTPGIMRAIRPPKQVN